MVESEATHSNDCVLFATADWDTPYWTNKQHTAHHLALAGYRVLYIESIGLRAPTMNGRDLKRIWQRLKRGLRPAKLVEPNVWVMSPLAIPFKQHLPIVRAINQGWLRARIKLFMLGQGFKLPMIWTYHPFMRETISKLPHGKLVYHCVDDLSAVPGIDPVGFNQEEQRLLAECAVVFVTSLALKDKCAAFNANTHYFSNVADLDHFGRAHHPGTLPPDIAAIPSPRIGYVGALSDFKVDFALMRSVAIARPDWHWVVIGAEREGQQSPLAEALRALPNVHFLGDKPYAVLPDYLRGFDVGTLPTLINEYTRSMFPMKYFEYLAAGVPVVSTPLEFTKHYQDGLQIAEGAYSFEKSISCQLDRGRFNSDESCHLVGENTWVKRLLNMINIIYSAKTT
jgi:glycosyltransferase involved in cell wall biosynthesis